MDLTPRDFKSLVYANFTILPYREPSSHLKSLAQSVCVLTADFIGIYNRHQSSVRWGFLIPLVADAGIERRYFLVMSQARYHFSNLLHNIGCSSHSIYYYSDNASAEFLNTSRHPVLQHLLLNNFEGIGSFNLPTDSCPLSFELFLLTVKSQLVFYTC